MARPRKALPEKVDVAHLISTGVLASVCRRSLIDDVPERTGKASQRERLLPAPALPPPRPPARLQKRREQALLHPDGYGILVKGAGVDVLWDSLLGLTLLGAAIFGFGVRRFRRQFG